MARKFEGGGHGVAVGIGFVSGLSRDSNVFSDGVATGWPNFQ